MTSLPSHHLNERVRGWLRHLWRKAMTPDDWSPEGEPHAWWDQYSLEPMLSFPRFDLSESSYGLLLMARKTPAWREIYTKILDELILRHTTYWAAVDWLTKIGPDPDRAHYPKRYKRFIVSADDTHGAVQVTASTHNFPFPQPFSFYTQEANGTALSVWATEFVRIGARQSQFGWKDIVEDYVPVAIP